MATSDMTVTSHTRFLYTPDLKIEMPLWHNTTMHRCSAPKLDRDNVLKWSYLQKLITWNEM
eukprot:13107099-Ditylum_brightwellii.AAC.1